MKNIITIIAILFTAFASAQFYGDAKPESVYLNVDLLDGDNYFSKGGLNIGISTFNKLDAISDNLVYEMGVGFFKNDASKYGEADILLNVVGGLGYKFLLNDNPNLKFVFKTNYRGYLIDGNVKGYIEPGLEVQFSDQFAMTMGHAYEVHSYGVNYPTGRLGFKFKL